MALVDYFEAEKLLKRHNIKSVESKYIYSEKEAIAFAKENPIVLKLISEKALHKSKSGLVAAGLETEKQIANAYAELVRKGSKYKPYKILAQKMVKGNIEIIVGGNIDEQFGKLVLLGLGGIYVEVFRDFALRVCPVDKKVARSMIADLKSRSIIARDEKRENMIADLLVRVSELFLKSDLKELDLNPIILHDNTYDAVDLRMIK